MKLQVKDTCSDDVFHILSHNTARKITCHSRCIETVWKKAQIQSLAIRFSEIIIFVIFSLDCQSTLLFFPQNKLPSRLWEQKNSLRAKQQSEGSL